MYFNNGEASRQLGLAMQILNHYFAVYEHGKICIA